MAARGQVTYPATYQMLLDATFRQLDSLNGVYNVGVVPAPDSDT